MYTSDELHTLLTISTNPRKNPTCKNIANYEKNEQYFPYQLQFCEQEMFLIISKYCFNG